MITYAWRKQKINLESTGLHVSLSWLLFSHQGLCFLSHWVSILVSTKALATTRLLFYVQAGCPGECPFVFWLTATQKYSNTAFSSIIHRGKTRSKSCYWPPQWTRKGWRLAFPDCFRLRDIWQVSMVGKNCKFSFQLQRNHFQMTVFMKELLKAHSALSSQKLHPEQDRHSSSLSFLLLFRARAPLDLLSWFWTYGNPSASVSLLQCTCNNT